MAASHVLGTAQAVFAAGAEHVEHMEKHKTKPHPPPFLVRHTLFILPLLVLLSSATLLVSYLVPKVRNAISKRRHQPIFLDDEPLPEESDAPPEPYMPTQGLWADFTAHIRRLRSNGTTIVLLDVLRLLCLSALLGLSIYATIQAEAPDKKGRHKHSILEALKKKKKKKKNRSVIDEYSTLEWGEFGACIFYLYNLLFCFLLLTLRHARLRRRMTVHVDLLLLLAFSLFAYRDIWPKLTYYLVPTDLDNWVTWTRVGILALAAVVIPLIRPRTYVPVNPLNPTPADKVHPEQTTAPLFLVFYEFMTPLVVKAWGTTALPYDDLHPLADYDRAEHLYNKHIATLDPLRRRESGKKPLHLFYGLLYTFRWEFFWSSVLCAGAAVGEMLPAIAINNVLAYLQADGVGAKIKPIVWVSLLFLGPLMSTLSINFYIFIMTRCLVRVEAVMTQLLFDHALRLRMKDSIGDEEEEKKPDEAETPLIRVEDEDGESAAESTAAGSANGAAKDPEAPAQSPAKSQRLVGKINVLMASDLESVGEGRDLGLVFVFIPIQAGLCLYLLFKILSWSALFGVGAMILTLPVPGLITKLSTNVQSKRMESTDARVDSITEAVGALRIIKMFGWEEKIKARVAAKREVELDLTWKRRMLTLLIEIVNIFLPVLVMAASFAGYTLVQKQQLTAATVFTSMVVFELLKGQMMMGFWMISQFVTSYVSLQRINKFMHESDLIDAYSVSKVGKIQTAEELEAQQEGLIRLKNATFAWGVDSTNKNIMNFRLRVPDVTFSKGKINLICGPTGSGKSSFLAALIGELHFEPQNDESFFYLPRDGGVSYAAQESWCMSASIKGNILFGKPLDEARYLQVLHDCALETDLKLFDDGDETEIGEKGVTLSGGQKARITLARAIYSDSNVVLLDDIFSALDTLTSRFILDNLFKGSLVKDRTILLVTHHTHLAGPIADYMVTLNEDGSVGQAGPIDEGMISQHPSEDDLEEMATIESKLEQKEANGDMDKAVAKVAEEEAQKKPNKLIKDEEKSEGRISRKALVSFFSTFGGAPFWILYFGLLLSGQAIVAFQTWWLGQWARAYEHVADPSSVSVSYWLGLYMVWVLIGIGSIGISAIVYYKGAMRASRVIHAKLVDRIFGAYMRFLDTTPVGRILSRFTKDMKAIDGPFTDVAIGVFDISLGLLIKFLSIVVMIPLFSLPAVVIAAFGSFIGELYIHSQLSVKREMSNAKSPLFSHLAASVSGIVSIRAYGAQAQIKAQTREKADKYSRAATVFFNLNRWVTVRIDMLGGLFAMSLASFLVYGKAMDASRAGFVLSQGISFASMILWWVRMINEMEVSGNAVERIEDYLVIDQEPASTDRGKPPASWPTSGELVLDNLSAKYSADGPTVLDNLTLHIQSGEKVGIVGRTGSGKSTLALALLRMVPTTGTVMIDGQQTDKINLHDLRTNVTIIPQDPILLSGSLRFNLDPFGENDDATLNDAMQRSGLGQVQRSASGSSTPMRITLDTQIAAGGSNLSQGQRQLVALARALVRQSKVLILDEATASVDFDTDALIQKSIRDLPKSTTVLTVAHRLATVMDYDKILVLGAGKLLEFDTPENLRNKKDSYFAKLVQAMEG